MSEPLQVSQEVVDNAEQEAVQALVGVLPLDLKTKSSSEEKPKTTEQVEESLADEIDEIPLVKIAKRGIGAPTKYLPEYCNVVEVICRRFGANRKHIAEALGISETLISDWIKRHPLFLEAIKKGREAYDTRTVEQSLKMKALGFEYEEVTIKQVTIKQGGGREMIALPAVEKTIVKKKAVPDVAACIFWLVNRQPEKWKHVARTIIQGDSKSPVIHAHGDITDLGIMLSDPQRAAEVKTILQEAGAFDTLKQDVEISVGSNVVH